MSAFEDMLQRKEAARAYQRQPMPTPSAKDYTLDTLKYILRFVQEHPNAQHARILGDDQIGQKRRRDALQYLVSTGSIVRSEKRPWRYSVPQGHPNVTEEKIRCS